MEENRNNWDSIIQNIRFNDINFEYVRTVRVFLSDGKVLELKSQEEYDKFIHNFRVNPFDDRSIDNIHLDIKNKKLREKVNEKVNAILGAVFKK